LACLGRWRAAFGDLNKRATQEESEVSSLKDMVGRLDGKHEELRETVTRLQEAITAGRSKVKEGLGNVQGELAKMKEEIRGMKLKPNSLIQMAPPAADAIVPPPQKAVAPARKCSSSPPPPPKPAKQFPPSVKKVKDFDVPHGIIAHLTRECGGNAHDRHVVEITSGSFEKETYGANPHSGAYKNDPDCAAKNAADLETDSRFASAFRDDDEDIPHTRNN
jgi:hypothetical protein